MSDRLDRAPFRPAHRRIAGALGIGWALDAFEVQIIGSVIPSIASDFGLSKAQQIAVFVVWFVGIGVGATAFGYLADRVGRRRLFVATLLLYSLAAIATAASPSYPVLMNFWCVGGIAGGLVSILFVSALLGSHGWRYPLLFGALSAGYALSAR